MASLRNLAIAILRLTSYASIAAFRYHARRSSKQRNIQPFRGAAGRGIGI
jgi:hypothetical protein